MKLSKEVLRLAIPSILANITVPLVGMVELRFPESWDGRRYCPAFVWDGVFIGATASPQLRNSTLLCAIGFFAVQL